MGACHSRSSPSRPLFSRQRQRTDLFSRTRSTSSNGKEKKKSTMNCAVVLFKYGRVFSASTHRACGSDKQASEFSSFPVRRACSLDEILAIDLSQAGCESFRIKAWCLYGKGHSCSKCQTHLVLPQLDIRFTVAQYRIPWLFCVSPLYALEAFA